MKTLNLQNFIGQKKTGLNVFRGFISFVLIATLFVVYSCNSTDPPSKNPIVDDIQPNPAEPGEIVTIYGKKFDENNGKISITFGTTPATDIKLISLDSIQVVVPEMEDQDVTVTVTVGTLTPYEYEGFRVQTLPDVEIEKLSATSGKYNEEIVIDGKYFGNSKDNLEVTINGVVQNIIKFSSNQITIKLAKQTFSGDLVIKRKELETVYKDEFGFEAEFGAAVELNEQGGVYVAVSEENIFLSISFLYKMDLSGQNLMPVIPLDAGTFSSEGLYMDTLENTLWIANFYGGIKQYYPETGSVETFLEVGEDESISGKFKDMEGDSVSLYVSLSSGGTIYKIDKNTKESEIFNFTDEISTSTLGKIALTKEKILIIDGDTVCSVNKDGTGLNVILDATTGYTLTSTDGIYVYHTGDILISISKQGGIIRLNKELQYKEFYPLSGLLTDEEIKSISEDKEGNLVLSTSKRLINVTLK